MKKIFPVIIFSLLINYSSGQDLTTLMRLNDFSISLGSTDRASVDTSLMKARIGKMNIKISEQLVYLLRAAEYYSTKDYENSSSYIQKVRINFKYPEYDNLKFLLFIGNYSNLKDLNNAAKYFYIVNKYEFIDPQNMKTMRSEIRNNFKKDDFDDALSYYFYYHQRLKIVDEIEFAE